MSKTKNESSVFVIKETLVGASEGALLGAYSSEDKAKTVLSAEFAKRRLPQPAYTKVGTKLLAKPQGVVSPGISEFTIEELVVQGWVPGT